MNSTGKKRACVRFEGHVQGVGFRYTAVRISENYTVTGTICNMHDGAVHMDAEGTETELFAFINDIENSFVGRYIRQTHISWAPASGEFHSFSVSYSH